MYVLIGSRALQYWMPQLKLTNKNDWDVISYEPVDGFEWHDPNILNNYEMALNFATEDRVYYKGKFLNVMSMQGLAIIKRSHLWRDYKFQSHITQYHKFGLARVFKDTNSWTNPFYIDRLAQTYRDFPHNHPKLNKSKDDFFTDAVLRKYDHDMLHELVAFDIKPMYTKLQPDDPTSVWCDKTKWDDLPDLSKTLCVAEETMVTALERYLIPNPTYPTRLACLKSLDKVCTTMCSGWFRDYAIDNYPLVIEMCIEQKLTHVLKKLGELK